MVIFSKIIFFNNRKIVRLVKPKDGKTVILKISASEEAIRNLAKILSSPDTVVTISGNKITCTFRNVSDADKFRKTWQD